MASFVIKGARVFDGRSFIGVRDVAVADGIISAVGDGSDSHDGEEIDARGGSLLPGLIDCHTHVFGDALVEALAFGVTTEIDMFTDASLARGWRDEQARDASSHRADIVSSGHPATAPGGHGTQYGIPIATLTSAEEAGGFVRDRRAEGSEFLKIIWEPGDGTWPTLDEPTIGALIDAARAEGMVSVIHVRRQQHARRAIELDVDGLAHIFDDEDPAPDLGALVARAGAFVVPTLSVVAAANGIASGEDLTKHERLGPLLSENQQRSLSSARGEKDVAGYERAARAVEALHSAGVVLLAGTDAANQGTAHGVSMHRELEMLIECGLSESDALAAATSRPAAIFGLKDRGVIEVGARADLLLVDGDPSRDIRATRGIAGVWKQGVRFDHAARRAALISIGDSSGAPSIDP
jgi:imidazolonepropionase-like amidohydrolase